jgi:Carboxypeptidase regulatory-like domain
MIDNRDVVRHRVAIAGRVQDASTAKPIEGAEVEIADMPAAFKKHLQLASLPAGSRWERMQERPDRTRTRPNGIFVFLDLPPGDYKIRARWPGKGKRFGAVQQTARVTRQADGNVKFAFLRLELPSTLVKGKVTVAGQQAAVVLARVRVKGSGERGFTDAQGQYWIAGIEPGKRTLLVLAQGYRAESREFVLDQAGKSQTVDVPLKRENG